MRDQISGQRRCFGPSPEKPRISCGNPRGSQPGWPYFGEDRSNWRPISPRKTEDWQSPAFASAQRGPRLRSSGAAGRLQRGGRRTQRYGQCRGAPGQDPRGLTGCPAVPATGAGRRGDRSGRPLSRARRHVARPARRGDRRSAASRNLQGADGERHAVDGFALADSPPRPPDRAASRARCAHRCNGKADRLRARRDRRRHSDRHGILRGEGCAATC